MSQLCLTYRGNMFPLTCVPFVCPRSPMIKTRNRGPRYLLAMTDLGRALCERELSDPVETKDHGLEGTAEACPLPTVQALLVSQGKQNCGLEEFPLAFRQKVQAWTVRWVSVGVTDRWIHVSV